MKCEPRARAQRYPQRPRECQPPPGIVTLRNSNQDRGEGGEGQSAAQMHDMELKIKQPPSVSICHVKLSVCQMVVHDMSNGGA